MHGSSAAIFLAQITVLLLVGRLLGELMQRVGQPAVMGQLLAGVLLGPSVFGALLPSLQHRLFPPMAAQQGMLEGVAQLGVLMLLLITGMEMDFGRVKNARRAALFASSCGIIVPFALGFALGEVVPHWLIPSEHRRTITALFLGTALAISSVKIVASVIRDLDFMRRNVGQIIVAAAIVDDTIGWIILSMIVGFARTGELSTADLAKTALSTAVFLIVSFTVGRRVVYFLIRWTNDHLLSEMPVITTTLVVMGVLGLVTQGFGVQTVLGAFVAGMLIGQSPILTKHIDEQLRGMIVALFMPVFFGLAGLSADLRVISTPMMGLITLAFIVIASVGKFAGAFAGGALGGLSNAESLALACGMNARGSTEVIVATIGLAVGALDTMLFTMIVAMAVVTTLLMPPMLRWAFSRIPIGDDERELLERAEFEQRGFVSRLERVLLATDQSPSARLASYLVGLITAPRGIPVTALAPDREAADFTAVRHFQEVRDAMEQAAVRTQAEAIEGEAPPEIDLIARQSVEPAEDAVAREGRKGYDLLVIGMEPLSSGDAGLSPKLARIAKGFERAVCLVSARGRDAQDPASAGRRILLPVIGEGYSRDTADLALALAQTSGARVTALYVATASARQTWRRRLSRSWSLADTADMVLRDVLELSRHYSAQVRTAIVSRAVPEEAILAELASGGHDLIVMGVLGVRPGDAAFPGGTSAALLERAPCSILLLAS
ncbi:MAG TPA: cation:proton antiporter [Steroidobacteraceae bacterium]|nr:cation:proton antiporter [Steroidobacteraceae bacterium]